MPRGRGQKCPECGRLTFYTPHSTTGACTCTNCGAQGWHATASPRGAGRGEECKICSNNTYRVVATLSSGGRMKHCSICGATTLVSP